MDSFFSNLLSTPQNEGGSGDTSNQFQNSNDNSANSELLTHPPGILSQGDNMKSENLGYGGIYEDDFSHAFDLGELLVQLDLDNSNEARDDQVKQDNENIRREEYHLEIRKLISMSVDERSLSTLPSSVRGVMSKMEAEEVTPNTVTYLLLLLAHEKDSSFDPNAPNKIERIEATIEEMIGRGIELDENIMLLLMRIYCDKKGNEVWLLSPDISHTSSVIGAN